MDSKIAYMGGIVRILTTLLGGYLTQNGWCTEGDIGEISGALLIVVTGIWSIYSKRKALNTPPALVK